jgi:hypothetical protein
MKTLFITALLAITASCNQKVKEVEARRNRQQLRELTTRICSTYPE